MMTNKRNLSAEKMGIRRRADQPISDETEDMVRRYKKSAAYKKFKQRFKKRKAT